jgi:hypothetical protein
MSSMSGADYAVMVAVVVPCLLFLCSWPIILDAREARRQRQERAAAAVDAIRQPEPAVQQVRAARSVGMTHGKHVRTQPGAPSFP